MNSRLPSFLLRAGSLFSLMFFAGFVGWMWLGGTSTQWATSGDKSGDLMQHYGASQLWREGNLTGLYRGFYLGDWINQWCSDHGVTTAVKIERFNYVYGPLIAACSALFASASLAAWIQVWSAWILLCYGAVFILFWKTEPGVRRLGAPGIFLFWGFPSFYYCLVPMQNGTMTLLILVSSGLLLLRNFPLAAGLVLSCAFYKPQLMPYLGFFALAIRQWRFAVGIGMGTFAWAGISFLVCGWEANRLWFESLRDMTSGLQFQRNAMNISLRGLMLTSLPEGARHLIDIISPVLSLIILGGTGWKVHRFSKTIDWWRSQHSLYVGLVAWTLSIPYCGHYEILLGLPWWLVYISQPRLSRIGVALGIFYWLISLASISGTDLPVSITSLFTLTWLIASLWTVHPSSEKIESSGSLSTDKL